MSPDGPGDSRLINYDGVCTCTPETRISAGERLEASTLVQSRLLRLDRRARGAGSPLLSWRPTATRFRRFPLDLL